MIPIDDCRAEKSAEKAGLQLKTDTAIVVHMTTARKDLATAHE